MKFSKILLGSICTLSTLPLFSADLHIVPVKEWCFTSWRHEENVDSPAIWHGKEGQNWIVTTAKSSHCLLVEDAINGSLIRRVGGKGIALGQFNRPNGITIIGDLCLVAERDNHRVQVLHLPDFTPMGSFGEDDLTQPYGITVMPKGDGLYTVYVTDNAEIEDLGNQDTDELTPEQLSNIDKTIYGQRVRAYEIEVEGSTIATMKDDLENTFGDIDGKGRLLVVESIFVDPANNRLLVADEAMEAPGHNVKIYTPEGTFTGKTIGDGIYEGQAEGIALVPGKTEDSGYWILTDQGKQNNYFHVFDRKTLKYISSFRGETTLNTDGCWFDPTPSKRFPKGVFYAVHNDGCVALFDWSEITETLGLE